MALELSIMKTAHFTWGGGRTINAKDVDKCGKNVCILIKVLIELLNTDGN